MTVESSQRCGSLLFVSCVWLVAMASPAHAANLSYTLSSEMLKTGCAYDSDGDCLDNAIENQLAQAAAPWYFYDEDEDCSAAQDAVHYGRKDFFQVRPITPSISLWQTTTLPRRVRVTYFFLHPHDCQSYIVAGGHMGDGEKVEYTFYSYDLKVWYLEKGRYWHHSSPYHDFAGSYLADIAAQLQTNWASVAADEDGHGSWPGETASSSACAGDEDNSWNDCFVGTMSEALRNGHVGVPEAYRNIGGPWPESWNSSVVNVSNQHAYSNFNVGHGTISEYWTNNGHSYNANKFCGWECIETNTDGDCRFSAHLESSCSTGLHEKVDYTVWAVCGDGACNGSESCSSCSADCGVCVPVVCGDGICSSKESCSTCFDDCGECLPSCMIPPCP